MRKPRVEVLYVRDCPHYLAARDLVLRVAQDLGVEPVVELREVSDPGLARRLRFFGSPTIRVEGRDVQPGADLRRTWGLGCRLYPGDRPSSLPDENWVRAALEATR